MILQLGLLGSVFVVLLTAQNNYMTFEGLLNGAAPLKPNSIPQVITEQMPLHLPPQPKIIIPRITEGCNKPCSVQLKVPCAKETIEVADVQVLPVAEGVVPMVSSAALIQPPKPPVINQIGLNKDTNVSEVIDRFLFENVVPQSSNYVPLTQQNSTIADEWNVFYDYVRSS